MTMELFDIGWYLDGGVQIFTIIALGLMMTTTVFTFLLWRTGNDEMFFKFIGYLLGSVALVGGLIAAFQFISGTEEAFVAGGVIFLAALLGALGLRLYLFIRDTWFSGGEKP